MTMETPLLVRAFLVFFAAIKTIILCYMAMVGGYMAGRGGESGDNRDEMCVWGGDGRYIDDFVGVVIIIVEVIAIDRGNGLGDGG